MVELSSSMEDYLEVIDRIIEEKGIARVKDIGQALKVKNSSVTAALKNLTSLDLAVHERYCYVSLTRKGKEVAGKIRRRHDTFLKFLTQILHVRPEVASVDACKMEHAVSHETFQNLKKFIEEYV